MSVDSCFKRLKFRWPAVQDVPQSQQLLDVIVCISMHPCTVNTPHTRSSNKNVNVRKSSKQTEMPYCCVCEPGSSYVQFILGVKADAELLLFFVLFFLIKYASGAFPSISSVHA